MGDNGSTVGRRGVNDTSSSALKGTLKGVPTKMWLRCLVGSIKQFLTPAYLSIAIPDHQGSSGQKSVAVASLPGTSW